MKDFDPTWLYIKRHKLTGLRYFGKTTKSLNVLLNKYKGGGLRWARHIDKHGRDFVVTDWYRLFTDKDDCTEFALFFSEVENIVESDQWANIKPEDGLMGGNVKGYLQGKTPWNKGKKQSKEHIAKRTGPQSEETKFKRSQSMLGKNTGKQSLDHVEKRISALRGKKQSEELIIKRTSGRKGKHQPKIICPQCGQTGGLSLMKRWHFSNCKKGISCGV